VLAKKRLTLHTPTKERTEPSPLLDLSQFLRPSESRIKEPQRRTLKVSQRKIQSAKLTTLKVDLEQVKNALRLEYAPSIPTLAVERSSALPNTEQ
jgi:hypothetical protein